MCKKIVSPFRYKRIRFAELEGTLQELHVCKTKLSRLKEAADSTHRSDGKLGVQDHTNASTWSLPGQPQHRPMLEDMDNKQQSPARVSDDTNRRQAVAYVQSKEAEDNDVPIGSHTRRPAYLPVGSAYLPPPYQHDKQLNDTTGMPVLRKILRDEMTSVIAERGSKSKSNQGESKEAESSREHTSTKHAWTADIPGDLESTQVGGGETESSETSRPTRPSLDPGKVGDVSGPHRESNAHEFDSRSRMPKTLEQASPITLPYFFGGFSRQSVVRKLCFILVKELAWHWFCNLCTTAYCIYLAWAFNDQKT